MRCANCGRMLRRPGIEVDNRNGAPIIVGPVCATRLSKADKPKRARTRVRRALPGQVDMFEVVV